MAALLFTTLGAQAAALAADCAAQLRSALAATARERAVLQALPVQGAGGEMRLVFAPRLQPLRTGRHFALDIQLCAPAYGPLPGPLRVDADMPAHRHGMNYRATLRAMGGGRFEAEGLMFHMPGRWRFVFELDRGPGSTPRVARWEFETEVE